MFCSSHIYHEICFLFSSLYFSHSISKKCSHKRMLMIETAIMTIILYASKEHSPATKNIANMRKEIATLIIVLFPQSIHRLQLHHMCAQYERYSHFSPIMFYASDANKQSHTFHFFCQRH